MLVPAQCKTTSHCFIRQLLSKVEVFAQEVSSHHPMSVTICFAYE